ncbi:RICIN domain-containing protein [Paenibacillus donghaensis]|uniref:Ricin B lectin domain-containing protein n=1 Tax=Paenibacillus donghaensis TaxID=414771 RepID=A0A2Z2KHD0_9BACL|nr:RICIN domain-containing protein [Paenibacillus donghaensis]ASA20252.1 hypothetical protein B9T62_05215 [Paenibacillus donghaensis]
MIPNQNQFYKIVNKKNDLVADYGYPETGKPVTLWPWHGEDNQRWMFVPLNDNYYAIVNKKNGLVADYGYPETGKPVTLWPWHGGDNQQWFLHDLEGGYQKISNKKNGLVADYGYPETGKPMTLWPWHGGDNQRWLPEAVESFTLPSVQTYPVPAVPQYTNINEVLPNQTQIVTTHYTLATCIAVDDPHYNDQQKIKTNPYYLYVKKQYWKKVESHVLAPKESYKYTMTSGMTQEDQNTVSKTVSHTIGVDAGFQFGKEGRFNVAASLSYQYTEQLETTVSHTTIQMTETTQEHSIINDENYNVAWSKYILVSEYSVQRSDGTLVSKPWTVTDHNTTQSSYYPLETTLLDK